MANKKITLTETELQNIISESVKNVLKENWFQDTYNTVKNKSKNLVRTVNNAVDDFHQGYKTKEGKPTNIKDEFNGNGWGISTAKKDTNGDILICAHRLSTDGGLTIEQLVEDLNIYLSEKNKGTASYEGQDNEKTYKHWFRIRN